MPRRTVFALTYLACATVASAATGEATAPALVPPTPAPPTENAPYDDAITVIFPVSLGTIVSSPPRDPQAFADSSFRFQAGFNVRYRVATWGNASFGIGPSLEYLYTSNGVTRGNALAVGAILAMRRRSEAFFGSLYVALLPELLRGTFHDENATGFGLGLRVGQGKWINVFALGATYQRAYTAVPTDSVVFTADITGAVLALPLFLFLCVAGRHGPC